MHNVVEPDCSLKHLTKIVDLDGEIICQPIDIGEITKPVKNYRPINVQALSYKRRCYLQITI